MPKLSRVGVLWDANVGPYRLSKSTEEAARSLDVEVLPFEVRGPGDIEGAVTAAAKARVGALIISSTPMTGRNRAHVVEVVTRHRLPTIAVWSPWPESGLLMAYGPSLLEEFGRAAVYVDKILKGAKPGDLPIEQPTRFELVIQ